MAINHYFCTMNYIRKAIILLKEIPDYKSTMKIAIIILNWNGKLLLEQFLPSII